jgi:GntR family transcriptional regulator, transcriptional repressor for pyruvate dehydrogenase complex
MFGQTNREHSSLVERTVTELQRKIIEEKLKPGQRLPAERSLCAVFGVSRATVREALNSLAVQGFVTRTRRGAVVVDAENRPQPAVDLAGLAARVSIRDLYEMRKLIEVRVASWAAMRATASDIEEIRHSVDAGIPMESGRINPNSAFHDALVRSAHNPVLTQIYESGRDVLFRLPFFWKLFNEAEVKSVRAWRHDLARRWHRHILQAIEQHDSEEAEGAMFQHLDIMEKDLLARLQVADGNDADHSPPHPMLADLRGPAGQGYRLTGKQS